jgi:hypothetical protein
VVEGSSNEVRELCLSHLRGLADPHAAAAIEAAAGLVRGVTRLFLRKLPGQLRIGLATAVLTRQSAPT